jgi:hypothetical protein
VWTFPISASRQLGECGGRVWVLGQDKVSACTLLDLPTGRDLAGAFSDGAKPLFGPDDEIGFDGPAEFAANAETCIKRAGYRFSASARRRLRFSTASHSTGEKVVYGRGLWVNLPGYRPREGDAVMDDVHLKGQVELVDETGSVAWSTTYTTSMPSSVRDAGSESDIAAAVSRVQQKQHVSSLVTVTLPRHVILVDGKPVALPGTSPMSIPAQSSAQ